jgi:prolipoprotein diacylglyceryltransferase
MSTALTAGLIRLGNLFNHEIVGIKTGTDFGFKFLRHDIAPSYAMKITGKSYENLGEAYDIIANNPAYAELLAAVPNRYPAQLYESICYFFILAVLFLFYKKTNALKVQGFLTGFFFFTLFIVRFFIEFIKENQEGIDQELTGLNMGQYLSIPLVGVGLFLMLRNVKQLKKGRDTEVS